MKLRKHIKILKRLTVEKRWRYYAYGGKYRMWNTRAFTHLKLNTKSR